MLAHKRLEKGKSAWPKVADRAMKLTPAQEKADATRPDRPRVKPAPKPLPPGLPEIERVIEPASTLCPCGCGQRARIGEDASRRLDVIPAQFRVLVTRRPNYACRRCAGAPMADSRRLSSSSATPPGVVMALATLMAANTGLAPVIADGRARGTNSPTPCRR